MTDERQRDESSAHGGSSAERFSHEPVMLAEIVELFDGVPSGVIVDATLGGGGHSRAILEAHPQASVLGLDRDGHALDAASENLESFGDRVVLRRSTFEHLADVVRDAGLAEISGFLFDLGVSSPQLDWASRGFSYRNEGPLDMRMNQKRATAGDSTAADRTAADRTAADRTAADIVNGASEDELARILREYGDERYAKRVAAAIVRARPISTTTELADVVRDVIPAPARRRGGHPAKRTFQALRIAVNRELEQLPVALDDAIALLAPKGRGAVLSYHSGEDRIVKDRFRQAETGGCVCPPKLPCVCGAVPTVRLLWRSGRKPSAGEIERNPRAESARLRALEKLDPATAGPRR